ncbi:MAG: acetyltransferase [Bacillota bacterium]
MRRLVIVGAGGFGREVAWLVSDINARSPEWDFIGFVDDKQTGVTKEGWPIIGKISSIITLSPRPVVVCAIGDPGLRMKLTSCLTMEGFDFATLIHPSVQLSEYVKVGAGSVVCAGTILTTSVLVGQHAILNPGCFVGHDTVIGDHASLMPGVNIAGEVTIGNGCYLGLNASVINRITIGEWSTIGAGAVVVRDIPPRVTAVGVPAKPIKTYE